MIVFKNKGELDVMALRTFGVSAKENDNAIGRFGTGLKYAIAVLIRGGCEIRINSGLLELAIGYEQREMRGKEFQLVMAETPAEPPFPLGFTTKLGQDWGVWEAFRELYSNCMDEHGTVSRQFKYPKPEEGSTTVCITGSVFEAVYDNRDEYILSGDPIWEDDDVAIHEGESDFMYYQGIRARELNKPSAFRYNIKKGLELTEDRTIKNPWWADHLVTEALAACDNPEIIESALTAGKESLERKFDYLDITPSPAFVEAVGAAQAKDPGSVPAEAITAVANNTPEGSAPPITASLSDEHRSMATTVMLRLRRVGIEFDQYPVIFAGTLRNDAKMSARGKRIYLADSAFENEAVLTEQLLRGITALDWRHDEGWLIERIVTACAQLPNTGSETE